MRYDACPKIEREVYILAGVPYVPHMTHKDAFVAPGGREISGSRLRELGARVAIWSLWDHSAKRWERANQDKG